MGGFIHCFAGNQLHEMSLFFSLSPISSHQKIIYNCPPASQFENTDTFWNISFSNSLCQSQHPPTCSWSPNSAVLHLDLYLCHQYWIGFTINTNIRNRAICYYQIHLWAPVLEVVEEKNEDGDEHRDGDRQHHHQAGVDHSWDLKDTSNCLQNKSF